MRTYQRTLFRAALQIQECLHRACLPAVNQQRLESAWRNLQRISRLASHAERRGWRDEDLRIVGELRCAAAEVQELTSRQVEYFARLPTRPQCTVGTIYEELLALDSEFDEVEVDLQEKHLSAITEPIELEGVELGRFQIRLDWSRSSLLDAYSVIALDPNPASISSSITHPHVRDERLCEGEGRPAIQAALQQGRLVDFFVLVRQVLETYNPSSPYVRLVDWSGVECSDCGCTAPEDDSQSCDRCSSSLCTDCSRSCGACSRTLCGSCGTLCTSCETEHCSACLARCFVCGERYCRQCLTDQQCQNCLESQENVDDESSFESSEAETERASPATAVHSICLGETGVPS